jgi:hypothetical protein
MNTAPGTADAGNATGDATGDATDDGHGASTSPQAPTPTLPHPESEDSPASSSESSMTRRFLFFNTGTDLGFSGSSGPTAGARRAAVCRSVVALVSTSCCTATTKLWAMRQNAGSGLGNKSPLPRNRVLTGTW